jgi:hypothetical protein
MNESHVLAELLGGLLVVPTGTQNNPTKQPDFPTGAPLLSGDTPQPTAPATTPSSGGTIGHYRPVPVTYMVYVTDDPLPAENDHETLAAWTPETSAMLDWLTRAEDDLHTLETTLRHLRRAVEEAVL